MPPKESEIFNSAQITKDDDGKMHVRCNDSLLNVLFKSDIVEQVKQNPLSLGSGNKQVFIETTEGYSQRQPTR